MKGFVRYLRGMAPLGRAVLVVWVLMVLGTTALIALALNS